MIECENTRRTAASASHKMPRTCGKGVSHMARKLSFLPAKVSYILTSFAVLPFLYLQSHLCRRLRLRSSLRTYFELEVLFLLPRFCTMRDGNSEYSNSSRQIRLIHISNKCAEPPDSSDMCLDAHLFVHSMYVSESTMVRLALRLIRQKKY